MNWQAILQYAASFLQEGDTGINSSSRLIAVGAATIMALYLFADIVARFAHMQPMNENVMITCVGALATLGGSAYAVNKLANKREGGQ